MLGVEYLATGQVRLSGEQIRVSVKLIETSSDKLVWGERFDRVRSVAVHTSGRVWRFDVGVEGVVPVMA